MDILNLTGLCKTYANGRGVRDINLTIREGQILGFLGPNGSGKTTTLKLIMGIIHKDAGEIEINGYNVETHIEQAIGHVGAMFESTVHYGDLTAFENLRQIARYHPNVNKNRLDELLGVVGLSQYRNEKVNKFSLGMRQRLSIAGAMYSQPKLLILDEPFNGLDIEGIVEIRRVIIELAEQYKTAFLISSHMASEMEKMCTDIAVIKDGCLLSCEGASSILALYPTLEDYFITQINMSKRGSENDRV